MKKSVGLVIITNSSPDSGLKVVLQRRGVQDSFPGACQVAVHGKLEGTESFYEALIRESKEEFGERFTKKCQKDIALVELVHIKDNAQEIITFGALVPERRLDLIRLERTSGGIDHVSGNLFFTGSIIEISPDKKREGYPPGVRAMFPDEITAVQLALKKFMG